MEPISIFDGRYRHQCQDLLKFFTEETYRRHSNISPPSGMGL